MLLVKYSLGNSFNPTAVRKAKIVYNFGLFESDRVKIKCAIIFCRKMWSFAVQKLPIFFPQKLVMFLSDVCTVCLNVTSYLLYKLENKILELQPKTSF